MSIVIICSFLFPQDDLVWFDTLSKDKNVFTTDLREVVSEPEELSYSSLLIGMATVRDGVSLGIQWTTRDNLYERGGSEYIFTCQTRV